MLAVGLYGVALVLAGVLELVARREDSQVPTVGEVCGFVMTYRVGPIPVGRIAVFGFWWWVGWHFFAR